MTQYKNTFEGTTVGATVNESSSAAGGAAISAAPGSGTIVFSDQHAVSGTRSCKFNLPSASGQCFAFLPTVAATKYAWQGSFFSDSWSGVQLRPIATYDANNGLAALVVLDGSNMTIRDNTNTAKLTAPIATAWPLNTEVKLDFYLDVPNGTAKFQTTVDGNVVWSSGTTAWTYSSNSATINYTRFGINGAVALNVWADDVAQDDAASDFVGVAKPTANAGADQINIEPFSTVTLSGSGTGGTLTYTWTQTAGSTVSLSGSGATRTFTAPATLDGDTLTFSLVVNNGTTNSDPSTVNVSVLPHTIWQLTSAGTTDGAKAVQISII